MRRLARAGTAVFVASFAAGALTGVSSATPSSSRAAVQGSVPPWAASAAFKGAAPASDRVGFRIYLGWRDSATAESLARAVSTPGSASYGKYLTPAQFRQRFAPTQSDVTAVQQWLRGSGFTVDYTPTNNHYVAAEGTVAQANAAFATTLGTYAYKGMSLLAPESTLSVPASLPAVSGVIGLDGTTELVRSNRAGTDAPPSPAFVNAQPMSDYWGQRRISGTSTPDGTTLPSSPDYPFAVRGYTPAQLRGAYGTADVAETGAGVTVAVIDAYASPTIVDDVNAWSTKNGVPTLEPGQFSQVVAPGTFKRPQNSRQDPQGWYGEETLDIEAVHGMAPGANIVYVGAPNNYQDLDAALNHVVDRKLATIVTNSYGFAGEQLPYGFMKPVQDTTLQAVLTGIGVYFSSGDSGDQTGGKAGVPPQADFPASLPYVTAVGGTSLAVGPSDQYLFENGWETGRSRLVKGTDTTPPSWTAPTYQYGSGGGTSRRYAQPDYQKDVVPAGIATKNGSTPPMRVVPDVSMVGDPTTGMVVGQTQSFPDGTSRYSEYRIGGTSLSSPLLAGVMALAEQRKGSAIGFANPVLYSAYRTAAFRDVTQPTQAEQDRAAVRVDYVNGTDDGGGYSYTLRRLGFDDPLTIKVRKGYDDVTGVGTPNGDAFLSAVAGT